MGMIANVQSMWSHRQQRQLSDVHHLTHRLLAVSKFITLASGRWRWALECVL
jgi:hypothetical protein